MTKKMDKDLQVMKKSSIFAPDYGNLLFPDGDKMVFEKCSQVPCNAYKPKEAMSIREMLIRTERGQRLDVNCRFRAEGIPDNMYMAEYEDVKMPDGTIERRVKRDVNEDTFDHTPPDGVNDIVDVLRLQEETNARKVELRKKRKQQTVANAPKPDPNPVKDPKQDEGPRAEPAKEA